MLSVMAASIYPDYPPSLTSEQSEYLLSNIKDWSILNGLAVRPALSYVSESVDPSRSLAVTAPVTLFPSLFPRACFEEARAIQTAYNELYALVARDERWLQEIVEEYAVFLSISFQDREVSRATSWSSKIHVTRFLSIHATLSLICGI